MSSISLGLRNWIKHDNIFSKWLYVSVTICKLSRNNLHHQSNQPPTPAHNHQSTNHEHLQSLTTTIHKLTHLSHSPAGLKVAWLTTLVDVHLSARPSWNSFTYSDTVHPASSALFIISLMLEALPELRWINYLLIRNYLSVSLTSMWQKTSS